MNSAAALADALARAFDPPASGFVGIVDNLLHLCRGGDLELAWRSNACHARIRQGTIEETLDLPLRKGVMRAILARVAALCNQHVPGSVSPYGGRGEIHLGPGPQAVFSAHFVNTAGEQSLRLADLNRDSMSARDPHVCSGDVGPGTALPPRQ